MKATIVNCTLKLSPETSNTEALLQVVTEALESHDVECELIRAVDLDLKPGVETDMGEGDDWPQVHEKLLGSEILYWNKGPGPGDEYLETDEGHDWSHKTARAAAQNLVGVARALSENPLKAPPE